VEEDEGRKAGKWVVATDGLAVLSAMQGGSRMTPLVAQVVDKAREGISFVYIPAHQGHAGNEKADELAKAAVEEGVRVEVQVPRGYTKGLARERTWRLWAAEWEAMRAEDEAMLFSEEDISGICPIPGGPESRGVGQEGGCQGAPAGVGALQLGGVPA